MVRNVKSFQPISQGKPQQALWIVERPDRKDDLEIYYVQGTVITFLCPMR